MSEEHANSITPPPSATIGDERCREQADRCRHLARDSTDPVLKVSLRRLADEYQMRADELENDEISARRGATRTVDPSGRNPHSQNVLDSRSGS
jgi:hypothetical protein